MAEYDRESLPPSEGEIADGVEASTTDATVSDTNTTVTNNLDASVFGESGLVGFEGPLIGSLPRWVYSQVSGGGSVTSDRDGTFVNPGGTASDVATLSTARSSYSTFDYGRTTLKTRTTIVFSPEYGTTTPTDNIRIGLWTGTNNHAVLDLTNSEFVVNNTSVATNVPDPTTNGKATVLDIEIDPEAGETTFTMIGDAEDTVTIADTPKKWVNLVDTVSNGSGDAVLVKYARH